MLCKIIVYASITPFSCLSYLVHFIPSLVPPLYICFGNQIVWQITWILPSGFSVAKPSLEFYWKNKCCLELDEIVSLSLSKLDLGTEA